MKNRAFTLIELLVVVLIIGILSAIALPQYRKAVEKARAAEGLLKLRTVGEAMERYYLANGNYPSMNDLNSLDVSVPNNNDWTVSWDHGYVTMTHIRQPAYGLVYVPKYISSSDKGKMGCDVRNTQDLTFSSQICANICGVKSIGKIWGNGSDGCWFQ